MTKIIYNLDPITRELIGQDEARVSPLEPDAYLIPASATDVEPPAALPGKALVFRDGQWTHITDPRGVWYDASRQQVQVVDLAADVSTLTREAPPDADHELQAGQWVYSAAQAAAHLAAMKSAKNAEINAARLAVNRSTFTHAGKVFACDELSRSDIDGANGQISNLGALPQGWPGGWKTVDNTYLPIATVAEWKAFYGSMFAAGAANFARAQALKETLAAATTAAQVAAIVW